ncbi:glutamic acid-rich protein-like [Branchiostoma floridae]|uniref:Glutamic acid-rich protein-like n=1 Tax=Branchiostoma floridae TaxID=7739 RepID=A0A9J7LR11_BRAFL|nr:glutamic acid-rich protein-like [Branchiostoma floridae]
MASNNHRETPKSSRRAPSGSRPLTPTARGENQRSNPASTTAPSPGTPAGASGYSRSGAEKTRTPPSSRETSASTSGSAGTGTDSTPPSSRHALASVSRSKTGTGGVDERGRQPRKQLDNKRSRSRSRSPRDQRMQPPKRPHLSDNNPTVVNSMADKFYKLADTMMEANRKQTATARAHTGKLPAGLSAQVRNIHRNLGELEYKASERFTSAHNEAVTAQLVQCLRRMGKKTGRRKACNRCYENLRAQSKQEEAGKAETTKAKKKLTSRRDRLFKSRLRVALELLSEEDYEFFSHSGPMYMSDEESDEEDKTVVWVKPPQWRAPRLTDMALRCQKVLDLNWRNNTTPSSNKERKRKDLDFTDRRRPSGRAAEMYIWVPEEGDDDDNSMGEDGREDHEQEQDRSVENEDGEEEQEQEEEEEESEEESEDSESSGTEED